VNNVNNDLSCGSALSDLMAGATLFLLASGVAVRLTQAEKAKDSNMNVVSSGHRHAKKG
jgi:hypothetical protein